MVPRRSSVRSIAITGVIAAAADQEEHLRRRRVGQHEVALGLGQPHDRAGLEAVDQVRGQLALGHRPHRDRDRPPAALGRRADGVRAPLELAVDLHADADVLAGAVVVAPAPAGADHERGGVLGLRDDLLDAAAQLARGPQRVDQGQVVVGVERGGELGARLRARAPTGWRCLPSCVMSSSDFPEVRDNSVNTCLLSASTPRTGDPGHVPPFPGVGPVTPRGPRRPVPVWTAWVRA